MLKKVVLYFYTLKNMKLSQIVARIRKKFGLPNYLGIHTSLFCGNVQSFISPEELDFDPVFLSRFSVNELMEGTITLLHSSKHTDWNEEWDFCDKSALWNFNLHYFEYLLPLVKAYKESRDIKYLAKSEEIIEGWIENNPVGKGSAWASYTVSLRIVTWLSYYFHVGNELPEAFRKRFLLSLHEQYSFLSCHLEKDILGNHYFENLKALLLASVFFCDESVYVKVLKDFKDECKEEILSDGMHFELSPMYHKIIFEGVLRIAIALKSVNRSDQDIEALIPLMLNVAYSFEDGLKRVPLFNDGGNNVAKSLQALLNTSNKYFNITPVFIGQLTDSGYYIFNKSLGGHKWKLIVDAGQPGPKYIPGHAHCDAMSFELFCDGSPIIVNCGTYAYQCEERSFFRSTLAHNTVMIEGIEQCQCWGIFRLAKRSSTKVIYVDDSSIIIELVDYKGHLIRRKIVFKDKLVIEDLAKGNNLVSVLHFMKLPKEIDGRLICDSLVLTSDDSDYNIFKQMYSEDYGNSDCVYAVKYSNSDLLTLNLLLAS